MRKYLALALAMTAAPGSIASAAFKAREVAAGAYHGWGIGMRNTIPSLTVVLLLAACGGGDEAPVDPPPPPPPPPAGIGAAGGTVQEGDARVVIPAGALAQNVVITIAQSGDGAPALPDEVMAVGPIYAFMPHGTTFATPATMSVPFDPALVPVGATATLYKTDAAQAAWAAVDGATITGSVMSGSVSGFSHAVVGVPRTPPPAVPPDPFRTWWFTAFLADDSQLRLDSGDLNDGALLEQQDFGPLIVAPEGHDDSASGEIFSNETGRTYWVETEAPNGDLFTPNDMIGSLSHLYQMQFYRKRESDATLRFVVSEAWIDAIDTNGLSPLLSRCPWDDGQGLEDLCHDELFGELDFSIALVQLEHGPGQALRLLQSAHHGVLRFWGWQASWSWSVETPAAYLFSYSSGSGQVTERVAPAPIFIEDQFDFEISTGGAAPGSQASMRLRDPVTIEVDISDIPVGAAFYIENTVDALAHNRRGRESFIAARLRDPASSSGLEWQISGLDIIEPIEIGGPILIEQPECSAPGATAESGTLQFSAATYGLPEFRHSSARVLVTRSGGSTGKVIAQVNTSDGSALAGVHYEPVTETIVFDDGDVQPRSIEIPIINDASYSGVHQFNLTLTPVANCANLGTPAAAVATILDDETPPPSTFSVGGSSSEVVGTGLVLQDVITGEELAVPADASSFVFEYDYHTGFDYDVRVHTQPVGPAQICSVSNGSGTVADANVVNLAITCTARPRPGLLDPTFGDNGRTAGALVGGAKRMKLLPDGRILLSGSRALRRFNADGSNDGTFGTGGEATVTFSGNTDEAFAFAVQPDGAIVVAGSSRVGTSLDFAVARYNADGTPDITFGSGGTVFTDFDGATDRARAVLIQPDGAIVVAGHKAINGILGTDNDFAVARYTAAGVLDATFGVGGKASADLAGLSDFAHAAALQTDGAIVLAGRVGAEGASAPDVGMARFNANGTLDSTFGDAGLVRIDYAGGGNDEATDVLIQPDGSMLVAGFGNFGLAADYFLARLNADGAPDISFGPGAAGFVATSFGPNRDLFANALAMQADGSIVIAGSAANTIVADFGVARFSSDGAPDTNFGTDGLLLIDFFGAADGANAVAIQNDGRIVVAGSARNGSTVGLGLARVLP